MRTRKTSQGLTVNIIAGTHVVVLGLKRKKCLGFAIQREEAMDGKKNWLNRIKSSEETDPIVEPGGQVPRQVNFSVVQKRKP